MLRICSIFFEHQPAKAFLNDLNSHLINCYLHVREDAASVWQHYNAIEISEAKYYYIRERFNLMRTSIKKSAYFIYLNHYCFNGIFRTNKKGHFNTPFGAKKKVKKKLAKEEFLAISNCLQLAEFTSSDFEDFLCNLSPSGACIYLDPPYFTNEKRVFSEYGAKVFEASDLARLHSVSMNLSKENKVIISYRDCEEFRHLFGDFLVNPISVTRNVGGFAGRRKHENELLAVLGA
ncbi:MAG: hypothetical protein CSB47_04500 [Proteobacteria bacterium]|nr:MAG: hypothetical protein CSB47_04500 [Pseudomonadota bacterium]